MARDHDWETWARDQLEKGGFGMDVDRSTEIYTAKEMAEIMMAREDKDAKRVLWFIIAAFILFVAFVFTFGLLVGMVIS